MTSFSCIICEAYGKQNINKPEKSTYNGNFEKQPKKGNIMRIASITKKLTKRKRPGASRLVHKKMMAGDSKWVSVNKPLQPFGKDLKCQTCGRGESVIGNIKTIVTKILIPGLATEASEEPIETKRERESEPE